MLLTIFTPTYNRAHTLKRAFESLCSQKIKDFEWLVVDDGSTDETECLVSGWIKDADFPIKYVKKENGGKHTAYNIALKKAKGELFFNLDSDDWLPNDFMRILEGLKEYFFQNHNIAGVVSLKADKFGKILGIPFTKDVHTDYLGHLNKKLKGEYSFIFKTEIAQKYCFPIFNGEKFIPETIVYDQFASFRFLATNHIMTICEYQPDGLSRYYKQLLVDNPKGYHEMYRRRLKYNHNIYNRILTMIQLGTFAKLIAVKYGEPVPSGLPLFWDITLRPFIRHLTHRYLINAGRN